MVPYFAGTRPRGDGVVVKPIFRTEVAVRPEHDQRGGVRLRQHASEVCSGTHIDLCGAATAGECAAANFTAVFASRLTLTADLANFVAAAAEHG